MLLLFIIIIITVTTLPIVYCISNMSFGQRSVYKAYKSNLNHKFYDELDHNFSFIFNFERDTMNKHMFNVHTTYTRVFFSNLFCENRYHTIT